MAAYRFELEDSKAWLAYLKDNGYVVIAKALSDDQVETTKSLLMHDIHAVHHPEGQKWPTIPRHGIVASLVQSAGAWQVRGNANVQNVFAQIWKTSDLITSMDAVIVWPAHRRPSTEGLHLDQNPETKPQLDCVQGMVPLLPVTSEIGGLEVIPQSHTDKAKEQQKKDHPYWKHGGDFCLVRHKKLYDSTRVLLECHPGDLILWDARLIHGGRVGTGPFDQKDTSSLIRLSVTVAMTPRAWASPEVLQARRDGFQQGISFNHCPHEAGTSTGTIHATRKEGYQDFELTDSQRGVL